MEYVKLGNTGLDVSKICLGGMSFGDATNWKHDWLLDEAASRKIIKKAFDLGINFFDTANIYSLGVGEEILGRAIRDFGNRDEVVLATKVNGKMREGPNGKGLSRKHIFFEVEESLKRLGTDYMDILYIHRWDPDTAIEETMRALNDLVRAGKVHYLGASTMFTYQFQKAQYIAEKNGWTKFSVMQGHYNLIYREEEREMNPFCKETGVALVPYSPLASGRLARDWEGKTKRARSDQNAKRKYDGTKETDKAIIDAVGEVADKHKATRAQVALSWLWEKGVTAPVVGATKEEYLEDAVKALEVQLQKDDMEMLEKYYVPHPHHLLKNQS